MNETWKPVVGYENLYEVSDCGRVRSLGYRNTRETKVLEGGIDRLGYPIVQFRNRGPQKCKRIHRLVAENFLEPDPLRIYVNHKNGIRSDNRLENLEWCTRSENMIHARDVLKSTVGERSGGWKLSTIQVAEIRAIFAIGSTGIREIASRYGVSYAQTHRIIHFKRRKLA